MSMARLASWGSLLGLACTAACGLTTRSSDELAARGSTSAAPSPPVARVPVDALFESHVVYVGLTARPSKLQPGSHAVVTQYWRLDAPLSAADRAKWGSGRSFLQLEGPNGRGRLTAKQRTAETARALGEWPIGSIVTEEFHVQIPEEWLEPAVWLFTGISTKEPGVDGSCAPGTDCLKVIRGPDDNGGRIRALTMRVKFPEAKRAPGWATEAGRAELGELVE